MFLIISRTFKEALHNFMRNGWLSVAAVTVLFLSLYVVSFLFVITKATEGILQDVQGKVNVSVYFKTDVPEDSILKYRENMASWPLVKSVDYVSRDKALDNFKKNNADNATITKSLDELGENPLWASLVVKANSPTDYEAIVGQINDSPFKADVSRVNFEKNREIIDKLNSVIAEIKKVGIAMVSLFGLISILITFNTVRITIYTHRKEIEVMRLVGASNTFIRLPFVFEGVIYAFIAMILSTVFLLITLQVILPHITNIISPQSLMAVFTGNLLIIIALELLVSIFLGVISSMIAIRRYLKV
jgi:cell division transport system permease protein